MQEKYKQKRLLLIEKKLTVANPIGKNNIFAHQLD